MNTGKLDRLPEGVGKKIVDALKKDAVEIYKIDEESFEEKETIVETTNEEFYDFEDSPEETFDFKEQNLKNTYFEQEEEIEAEDFEYQNQPTSFSSTPKFNRPQQPKKQESHEEIEMPANIDILKRLISQLPPGVTRQTGAQIIRQTMEAMGISMKSVLSEAQLIQEELGGSAQGCINTIEEYKNNIRILEKKVQSHKKQAAQIGELINLFIMTEKKLNR
ncbi:MAG: hypothetical protein WC197_01740 [Candidatus Gastranaerophilaceae bacterium]